MFLQCSNQQTLQSSAENLQIVMKTTDGRDKDILDKQGVERDFKYREETLKDAPISSNNIKESQQTLFPRENENKQKAKITVHTIEEAMTTNKERTPVSVWCRHFWHVSHVVTSLYFRLISWVRPSNLVIVSLSNKDGGGYENVAL